VKDASQGAVVGAKVTITNVSQGSSREVQTSSEGTFAATNTQPGTYNVSVEAAGFKKYEQKEVSLFAGDRLSLDITLTIGGTTETVTVTAEAAQIQSASAERSGVLTNSQVVNLALTSRNLFDLVKTIPGVVYTGGLGGIAANGNRNNQNNFTLDGVTNVDTGSNGGTLATTNMDMIADMKITTNSQPAEHPKPTLWKRLAMVAGGLAVLGACLAVRHYWGPESANAQGTVAAPPAAAKPAAAPPTT